MLDIKKCEMCGKKAVQLHDHHVIPWFFSHDDSESNIMRLCRSCHKKADQAFVNLILYGDMDVISRARNIHKRASSRYSKKYVKGKGLFHIKLLTNTYYQDSLSYNIKTGVIHISAIWSYRPYKYCDRRFKNRVQLTKAASVKGQTTLIA